ncbi:MAG: sulfatase-like hydrolase/transferase [Candidatus Nealsonbacteria bacterium]|nr:sulfatase-like hydrolase/transferase [Candidatus Nealsonbacteria bacterium]
MLQHATRTCLTATLAALLLHHAGRVTATEKPARPNFVIIMADDMGYGDSSLYDGWVKTPRLDRMAKEGLKFTDFHSSGTVCSPTRAGLVTGRYQQRAGLPAVITADPKLAGYHVGLQTAEVTFAELLGKAGYATAIFGKWHLGYSAKFNPLHHGFDRFRGFVSGNVDYISHYDRMQTYDWWEGLEPVKEEGYLTHLISQHAVEFIETHKDGPFCLYVPHGAVHSPIQAPGDPPGRGPDSRPGRKPDRAKPDKAQRGAADRRDRDATVRQMFTAMDQGIGEILDTLQRLNIAENTLVLFFSDNGGASHCRNDPLRGGKGSVWEGGHRVPAVAWWPGKIKPGTLSDDLCISLDVMPTMLDLAGVPLPKGLKLDGVSLAPLLLQGKSLGRRQLFWEGTAMRDGPWKLVVRARGFTDGPALFNLDDDLGEQNNLAEQQGDRVRQMRAAIEAWKQDVATGATQQPPPPR